MIELYNNIKDKKFITILVFIIQFFVYLQPFKVYVHIN